MNDERSDQQKKAKGVMIYRPDDEDFFASKMHCLTKTTRKRPRKSGPRPAIPNRPFS